MEIRKSLNSCDSLIFPVSNCAQDVVPSESYFEWHDACLFLFLYV